MHRSWLAGVVAVLAVMVAQPVEPLRASSPATLLVIGDSLSAGYGVSDGEGWVALLERRLADRALAWNVVNASISGDTTTGGAARLAPALKIHSPDIVVLELGGNDGLRGQPLPLVESNLATMIEMSQAARSQVLLVGMRIPPNYGPVYTTAFEEIFHALQARYGVALVPFLLDGVALDPQLMQDDGIHPTSAAQSKLLDNVWKELEALVEKVENGS